MTIHSSYLVVVFFFSISCAEIQKWELTGSDIQANHYVDRATIRLAPNQIQGHRIIRMWSLYDYKSVQTLNRASYFSYATYYEFDCQERLIRLRQMVHYGQHMGMGPIFLDSNYIDEKIADIGKGWQSINPGSINATRWRIACEQH